LSRTVPVVVDEIGIRKLLARMNAGHCQTKQDAGQQIREDESPLLLTSIGYETCDVTVLRATIR
jgi:hypothetical protein